MTHKLINGELIPMDEQELAEWQASAPKPPTRAQLEAKARERARVIIKDSRLAVANMIAVRDPADLALPAMRQFSAALVALLTSVNLAASTDEKIAFDLMWAAYLSLIAGFSPAIRLEYKREFEAITKEIK
jgi:uncharacterized membrane protein